MSPPALAHPMTAPRDRTLAIASASWVVGAGATGVQYFGAQARYGAARGWVVVTADEHRQEVVSVDLRSAGGVRYESGDLGGDAPGDALEQIALQVALAQPAVESTPTAVPNLTGNPVLDVRALTGLTAQEFGALFGRTERAGQEWRRHGVPERFRAQVEALRAIGLTLVGGLGPDGVKHWLLRGDPSPWERIQRGEIAQVAEEVHSLEDSLAT